MAKTKPQTTKTKPATQSRAVAKTSSGANVPAHLAGYKSEGAGVPSSAEDVLIPMARPLDAKSPEVTKGNPNQIPGAEAGDILIKNAPNPIVKSDKGFLFQPCFAYSRVVEWLPRTKGGGGGGGFVASHPADFITKHPELCEQRPNPENPAAKQWFNKKTGNMLQETRYYIGWMIPEDDSAPLPMSLPFKSTGHTVAKGWNMLMQSKRINGERADMWLVYYRVKSAARNRRDQSWFVFDISDAGEAENGVPTTMWCPTTEDVERGRIIYENFASGKAGMAVDEASTGGAAGEENM